MRIALNGWPLSAGAQRGAAGQGLDLAAHALLAILNELPGAAPGCEFCLVHPAGVLPPLPEGISYFPVRTGDSVWSRIRFEQLLLPSALRRLRADGLWTTVPGAPLRAAAPVLTPAYLGEEASRGGRLGERLQRALARAGADGAALRTFPDDLSIPTVSADGGVRLRPHVGASFRPEPDRHDSDRLLRLQIDQAYVLCHNPGIKDLHEIFSAWTWVTSGTGDAFSLVIIGLDRHCARLAGALTSRLGLSDLVHLHPEISYLELPAIYRCASAFLGAGRSEGHELRHALASGLPIAAPARETIGRIVGPAGYLTPPGEARLLGAACLAILVEDELAEGLRARARVRAEPFQGPGPLLAALKLLEQAAHSSPAP